ncbi:hypothetical protein CPG38_01655 [Malaciobacter marinus]|uniref:AbiJ-NTD4 domain-containing protein n=1 Tax=Malaciobacter marinus TaxID=505249 RepID=UPI000C08D9D3|nr:hypothetical protein [Malaciobacter marinus]PHO13721.1 hypothetical protein CPG38_01655 [Malaciobacter marinus]
MYFSDIENGVVPRTSEEISIPVWNGIVSIFEEYKNKNYFSENFSEICSDNNQACGFDGKLFEARLQSEVPNIEKPIQILKKTPVFHGFGEADEKKIIDKYATLDFIEFCHKNIAEPTNGSYHDFFQHYHLTFKKSEELESNFREKINQIFERNGILFYINEDGQINRNISESMKPLINQIYNTADTRLNDLVKLAYDKFVLPKIEDRIFALEKIWDAFERMKTYYIEKNKKESINDLISLVSNNNTEFGTLINTECNALTAIGNNYQIRHFETNKIELTDNKHIDYLFYRMVSIMQLFMSELE